MKKARKSPVRAKRYPPESLMGRIKKREIITTLAAFISGGWFVYEIVHWILVDHYHFPERFKDVVIVSILCAMLCALAWRWFRGGKKKRGIKFEYLLIPIFVLIAGILNTNFILHMKEKVEEHYGDIFSESVWKNSVVVLPFVNMSSDKEQEYFCDGLTEELITKLT